MIRLAAQSHHNLPFLSEHALEELADRPLLGQTAGAVIFGAVAHALGYASMWSVLTMLLLIGSALSMGLPRAPAR